MSWTYNRSSSVLAAIRAALAAIIGAVVAITFSCQTAGDAGQIASDTYLDPVVGPTEVAANEVLVRFRAGATVRDIISIIRDAEHLDLAEPIGNGRFWRLKSTDFDTATLIRRLRGRAEVDYVEPNFVYHTDKMPSDPLFGQQWSLQNTGQTAEGLQGIQGDDISALLAWDVTTGSKDNVVAVIDTGIEYTHPDLKAQMWAAPHNFSITLGTTTIYCKKDDHGIDVLLMKCNPGDVNGHGTAVAGVIAAQGQPEGQIGQGVTGLNWTASILSVRTVDSSGSTTAAAAVNAISAVIQIKLALRPEKEANIRIISNSWGGHSSSQALLEAIVGAETEEMLFVAAAGNLGTDNDTLPFYPASYDVANVLSVTATNNQDLRPTFANYGARSVAMAAPGVGIVTTSTYGKYSPITGTSLAAPFVSGAAALVLSHCAMTTAQLKAAILDSVDVLPSLENMVTSSGRLNVNRAVHSC